MQRQYTVATILLAFLLAGVSGKAQGIKELNSAIQIGDAKKVDKILKDKKVNLNDSDEEGMTPLMNAVQGGNIPLIKTILKKKVDLETKNKLGDTALAMAVGEDQSDAAKILINAGANVDVTVSTEKKDTLLIAAAKSHLETTKLILSKNNTLLNKTNTAGDTALMASVRYGYNDIAQLLISKGADTKLKNKAGKTALDIAKESNNDEAIKLLSKK